MSRHFGAVGAALISPPEDCLRLLWSEGFDAHAQKYVREGWHSRNDRLKRLVSLSDSRTLLLTDRQIFDEREITHNPFNADFIRKNGLGPFAGAILYPRSDAPVLFTIDRKAGHPEFDAKELAGIESILPHLQRAFHLANQIGAAHSSGMLDALDRIGGAAILLSATGKVVCLNKKADHLFEDAFVIEDGLLAARASNSRSGLEHLIAGLLGPKIAAGAPQKTAVKIDRLVKPPLLVQGAPLPGSPNEIFQRARAILLISDPTETKSPDQCLLRQIFGLTSAEARVAVALAKGHDTTVIGSSLQIKPETVRLHIKRILEKSKTSRQVELVSTLKDMAFQIE